MPQPVEVTPFLTPDAGPSNAPTQGTDSLTDTAMPGTSPPTDAVTPTDPPRPHEKGWKRFFTPRTVLLVCLASFLIAAPLAVAMISDLSDRNAFAQLPLSANGVAIVGDVSRFDWLDTQKLSVTWFIVGQGGYQLQAVDRTPNGYLPVNRAVDIYLDSASEPAFSYDPTNLPMTGTGVRLGLRRFVSFDMEHGIGTGDQYSSPLDQYNFTALVFVIEKDTNKSVPITTFVVGDAGPADFTTTSVELPTTNNFTYDAGNGPTTVEVNSTTVFATVKHSNRARSLTFSMFVINWVLTLCSVVIALIVLRRQGGLSDGIAFLPLTVILSTPTIRSLYVGSPPFGILLDMLGFFPQMLIALVSAIIVLYVFATRPTRRDRGITFEKKVI